MEIKQCDKVKVSKDAPKMYLRGFDHIFTSVESVVSEIEDDNAVIIFNTDHINSQTTIPTKYLVKVDAEAKEAKFKYQVGQKVKSAYADEILTIKEHCGRVGHDNVYRVEEYAHTWNECELRPYTEPTERTEKKPYEGISEETVNEISDMLEAYAKALSGIADSFDWQRYTADLAKEVALKVANKYNDPKEAAEYAVSVANAVVEGLKRK